MKNKIKSSIKSIALLFKRKKIIPINNVIQSDELLKDKVALITGGSGGIGFAIAKRYIKAGCKVIISGTNEKKLQKYQSELGNSSSYIVVDFNNVKDFKGKVDLAAKIYGKIDILVNSVGVHTVRPDLNFVNIKEEEYDNIMNLNLKGTYFFSQAVAKYMIKNKIMGHILIISSQSALEPAWSPYRLSKWGIKGMISGLAQQLLPYGIIVNGIGPGPTATSMQPYNDGDSIYTEQNPINRYTMPDEIAIYAEILVSDLGNTVVGDTIYMSGGRGIIEMR